MDHLSFISPTRNSLGTHCPGGSHPALTSAGWHVMETLRRPKRALS